MISWLLKPKNNWAWTIIKWMAYVIFLIETCNLPLSRFSIISISVWIFAISYHFESDK